MKKLNHTDVLHEDLAQMIGRIKDQPQLKKLLTDKAIEIAKRDAKRKNMLDTIVGGLSEVREGVLHLVFDLYATRNERNALLKARNDDNPQD